MEFENGISEEDIINEYKRLKTIKKGLVYVLKNKDKSNYKLVMRVVQEITRKASFAAIYNINDIFQKEKNGKIKIARVLNIQARSLKYKGTINNNNILQLKASEDVGFMLRVASRKKDLVLGSMATVWEGEPTVSSEVTQAIYGIIKAQEVLYNIENQKVAIDIFRKLVIS